MLKDHNAVTPVRLEPVAPRSPVKHSTTEPLHYPISFYIMFWVLIEMDLSSTITYVLVEKYKKIKFWSATIGLVITRKNMFDPYNIYHCPCHTQKRTSNDGKYP